MIYLIDVENEWLLLSASFMAKFRLVFVLRPFLRDFIFKPRERTLVLLKIGARDFQNRPPFERSACFSVTISQNFERF